MPNKAKEVETFFDDFATSYDQSAFYQSYGTRYLTEVDYRILSEFVGQPSGKEEKILEMGVGTGRNLALFKNYVKAGIVGLDISEKMMNEAKRKYIKDKRIKFIKGNLSEKSLFKINTFDKILCIRVIKYVINWRKLLNVFYSTLKPGGFLILEISNKYSVQYFGRTKSTDYNLFRLREMVDELRRIGFEINRIEGGTRVPFPLYKLCNLKVLLAMVQAVESLLRIMLGKYIFSRNYYLLCQKPVIRHRDKKVDE